MDDRLEGNDLSCVPGGEHSHEVKREEEGWEGSVGDVAERKNEIGRTGLVHEAMEVDQTDLRLMNGLPWECWATGDFDVRGTFQSIRPNMTSVSLAGKLQSVGRDGLDASFAQWMTGRHGRPPDWAYEKVFEKVGVSDASCVEQCFSVWQMGDDMPPVIQSPIFFGVPFWDPGLNMRPESVCVSTIGLPMNECEGIRLDRPPDILWSSSSDLAMNRFLIDKSGRPPDISLSSSSNLAMNRLLIDKSGRPPGISWSSSSELAIDGFQYFSVFLF